MARAIDIMCIEGEFPRTIAGRALAVIDVIRATTTAITAVECGLRCFPVASLPEAERLAAELENPILAGEVAGIRPDGFEVNNSPVSMVAAEGSGRPVILLSTGGSPLMREATTLGPVELACFRNLTAVAARLARREEDVTLLARTTRGEFRVEDQMCGAWIAERLTMHGLDPLPEAERLIDRWHGVPVDELEHAASVGYLRRSGQMADWAFIRSHIDDLSGGFVLVDREVSWEQR
jgi:2-phosphosulfolactate phosphatase